jgi:DNA-binding NarL/FixJ family response regulator
VNRPRVLLADDHKMVAQGLKSILEAEFELIGVVDNGRAMVEAARQLRPDAIVADITMPELNGIEAMEALRAEGFGMPVVFLTMHRQAGYARRALETGAAGYVLKHAAPEELVQAVRAALDGGTFVSPAIAGDVLDSMKSGSSAPLNPAAQLTPNQRQLVRLLADGLSAKEIARKRDVSSRTVESQKYQLMEALGTGTTAELIRFAIRHGIVEP